MRRRRGAAVFSRAPHSKNSWSPPMRGCCPWSSAALQKDSVAANAGALPLVERRTPKTFERRRRGAVAFSRAPRSKNIRALPTRGCWLLSSAPLQKHSSADNAGLLPLVERRTPKTFVRRRRGAAALDWAPRPKNIRALPTRGGNHELRWAPRSEGGSVERRP